MKHTFVCMFRDNWTRYSFAKVLVGNWFSVSVVWTYSAQPVLLFCKSNRLQLQQWMHPLLCEEYVCKFTLLISFQFLLFSLSVSHLCLSFSAGELWTADAGGGLEGMNLWAHSCYVETQPVLSLLSSLSVFRLLCSSRLSSFIFLCLSGNRDHKKYFKKEQLDGGVLYYIKRVTGLEPLSSCGLFCVDSKCMLVGNREL